MNQERLFAGTHHELSMLYLSVDNIARASPPLQLEFQSFMIENKTSIRKVEGNRHKVNFGT